MLGLVSAAAAAAAVSSAGLALAQNQPAAEAALQEVIVTGSRLNLYGTQAPTPVTVIGAEEIAQHAPKDISEFVEQVPSIAGSMTPTNRAIQTSNGTGGLGSPSLRGLGTNRTLILLDGQRVVQGADSGEVDIEAFPQQLISRIEVVTGGASAVYGSDALSGVVNFVLDRRFTGFKADLSGGITEFGDDPHGKVALSGGFGFAGGRGHILLSGEMFGNQGINGTTDIAAGATTGAGMPYIEPARPWQLRAPGAIVNPAFAPGNGQPLLLVGVPDIGGANYALGGLITSGPLRGTAFDLEGRPYQFQYGLVAGGGGINMSGGSFQATNINGMWSLNPKTTRNNLFGRASFDLTDSTTAYVQVSRGATSSVSFSFPNVRTNVLINADNAFLPDSVRAAAQARGVTSFQYGFVSNLSGHDVNRTVKRYVVGIDGGLPAFGKTWTWSAHASHATTEAFQSVPTNRVNNVRAGQAFDAVVNPQTGTIVCRVTLTNPSDPCIPFNVFGFQQQTQAARDFYYGVSWRTQDFTLNDVEANITGEPFSTWAGPVAMALGAEYRKNEVSSVVDPRSAQQLTGPAYFGSANFFPLFGEVDVKEGYLETKVPLARDTFLLRSLELSGSVRATDYSTSGNVTTWKAGAIWSPIDDIRFRVTRSQDIRAPSLFDLYSKGQQIGNSSVFRDPLCNCSTPTATTVTVGNIDLTPEIAQTFDVGVVLQPRFMPGFVTSVDFYKIKIDDAIGIVAAQDEIDECYNGVTVFCNAIVRTTVAGYATPQITLVYLQPFNFATEEAQGLDIEMAYRLTLSRISSGWPGTLNFRGLVTHFIKDRQDNGITLPVELSGVNAYNVSTPASGNIPNWKYSGSITFDSEPLTVALSARGMTSGVLNNSWIVCEAPNCPTVTATTATPTVTSNHAPGAFYLDATVSYRPQVGFRPEFYLSISNLFDKDPGYIASNDLPYKPQMTNPSLYDLLGRRYRAGVRFTF